MWQPRKALIDGDIFVYRAGFATNDEPVEEAIKAFDSLVASAVLDAGCVDYQVYITGKGNFRYDVAKTAVYKGNRKDTAKPVHIEALREHAVNEWEAIVSQDEEADDLIAIEATRRGILNSVIVSVDKDFLQVPGLFFNPVKKQHITVDAWSGLFFFYQQILMGDSADNIMGIKGIGPKTAHKILTGAKDERELYERCVQQYNGDTDRVLENALLLWLRREPGQIWKPPVC